MKQTKLALANPPLYMMNNLTSTQSYLAYISLSNEKLKLNIINKSSKELNQIIIEDQSIPTSLQYQNDGTLIVTTFNGYYIYSENGQSQYHKLKNQLQDNSQYFIGSILIMPENQKPFFAIGFENKIVFVDQKQPKTEFFGVNLKNIQPICLTGYYQYLVYGDAKGILCSHKCLSLQQVTEQKSLDLETKQTTLTALRILERKANQEVLVVAADFIGRITLIDLIQWQRIIVINAHLKPITALTINQQKEFIISASEDTYINIWRFNQNSLPQLVVSHRVDDQVITGVTQEIFVASYDSNEIIGIDYN